MLPVTDNVNRDGISTGYSSVEMPLPSIQKPLTRWCSLVFALILPWCLITAQVAMPVVNRSYLVYDYGATPKFAENDSVLLLMTGYTGVIRSIDSGKTFFSAMPPSQVYFLELSYAVAHIANSRFIATGWIKGMRKPGRTFESGDNGRTWMRVDDSVFGNVNASGMFDSEDWDFPGDAYPRYKDYFSTDSGYTWKLISPLDSLPYTGMSSGINYRYLDSGRYEFRLRSLPGPNEWQRVSIEEQSYVESEIPDEIVDIYRMSDGALLGLERHGLYPGSHFVFRRQASDSAPFSEITFTDKNAVPLDATYFWYSAQLEGKALLLQYDSLQLRTNLLVITDTMAAVLHIDSVLDYGDEWGEVLSSSGNRCLVSTKTSKGTPPAVVLLDADTRSARPVFLKGTDEFLSNVLYDSTAVSLGGKGRVTTLNLNTGTITLGGRLFDEYNRLPSIAMLKIFTNSEGTFFYVDELGDLVRCPDDETQELFRSDATYRTGPAYRKPFDIVLYLGVGLVWEDSGAFVGGGRILQRVNADQTTTVLSYDTTSFWHRASDGTEYTGYRTLLRRSAADTAYMPFTVPWDARVTIGCMASTADGRLFAGLRGYAVEEKAELIDTVEGGMWTSGDDGDTWTRVTLPVDAGMITSIEQRTSDSSLWASVTNVTRAKVAQVDELNIYVRMSDITLLRSTDHGATWKIVNSQQYNGIWQPTLSNCAFWGENVVAWVTVDRVYWSANNGESWSIVEGTPSGTAWVSHAAFDTYGNLLIGTSEGIYRVPAATVGVDETDDNEDYNVDTPREVQTPVFWAKTFPNPTDRSTTLRMYNLDKLQGDVNVFEIVNILGERILDLKRYTQGQRPPGTVDVEIDLGTNAPGVYLLVCSSASRTFSWPLLLRN